MKKKLSTKRAKVLLFFTVLTGMIIGLLLGIALRNISHESGHYIAAFIFNKSAIKEIKWFIPENMFSFKLVVPWGRVGFVGPFHEVFKFPQDVIVAVSGPILEITTFLIVMLIFGRIFAWGYKKVNLRKFIIHVFALGIFVGVTLGFVNIIIGGGSDIKLAVDPFVNGYPNKMWLYPLSLFLVIAILSVIYSFYFLKAFALSMRTFGRNVPSRIFVFYWITVSLLLIGYNYYQLIYIFEYF